MIGVMIFLVTERKVQKSRSSLHVVDRARRLFVDCSSSRMQVSVSWSRSNSLTI